MSVIKYNEFFNSKKINIDLYCLYDFSNEGIKNSVASVKQNKYRALFTLIDKIDMFKGSDVILGVLINYPNTRNTKYKINESIDEVLRYPYISEVEFVWNDNFLTWGAEYWRKQVQKLSANGIILRPMLELGLDSFDYVEKCINFFKSIGIFTFTTSSGLVKEVTTVEKLNEYKAIIPFNFSIKVICNLKDKEMMNKFNDEYSDFILGTSIDILNTLEKK